MLVPNAPPRLIRTRLFELRSYKDLGFIGKTKNPDPASLGALSHPGLGCTLNLPPAAVCGRISGRASTQEGTMCYSKYWQTEDERRQREAKTKEAEAKRTETVRTMLADAEKQVNAEAIKVRESAPAK
jgi:hypothetical protein